MDTATALPPASRLWRGVRTPLLRMLMLSLSLHVAVVMVVRPRPYQVGSDVVVVNARLVGQPARLAEIAPEPTSLEPLLEPVPVEPLPAEPVPAQETQALEPETDVSALPMEGAGLASVPVLIDAHWYEARQLDVQPKASVPIVPNYPAEAILANQPGSVKLMLKIDEFGVVQEVEVEESEPPDIFDESALLAFKQGRFEPARKDGRAVRSQIYVRVTYEPDASFP